MCLAWLHTKGSLHPSEWKWKEELEGRSFLESLCSSRDSSVIILVLGETACCPTFSSSFLRIELS